MKGIPLISIFICISIFVKITLVECIEIFITLNPKQMKCMKERINKDTLVVAKFKTDKESIPVSASIYDIDVNEKEFNPSSKIPIFESTNEHDIKTAFTTFYTSSYSFCSHNNTENKINVHLEIKYGSEAKDYTQIAKSEHLNEAGTNLKKIIDQMNSFHKNLIRIKEMEEKEKVNSDKLNDTLMWFSIVTIIIIIITAVIQDFYFKKFFTSKKII